MKTIGEKLRDLRNIYGLSQREFGEKIGVARGSINSYENNVNPLTQGVKWKILQGTGIGFDYFDTDMSLNEAFIKYGIDPSKKLEFKETKESICAVYKGINNFMDGKCEQEPLNIKSWFLDSLFEGIGKFDICFINVSHNELEPYAKNNEILVVVRDGNLKNGDKIIIDFKGSILVVQYFKEFDEIRLQTLSGKENKLKESDFKKEIKILAIIKGKIC
ncbi:transcriptional regulator, XRE family [Campylobacter sp. MIT 12-8780]|uniref:helix-turn-helix domain-containing protein n=1 Tax=unclassified Campylobacter TaxID=2593542 RepID=UPI0010F6497B|nr:MULTISPECIES: helix-turn-helix transcriptional regulator [unclassified Campylobacter]NDJ28184.1 helix-turn-helix transcriptional regulator [Campylobacter sp. MIT 19-121]TKX28262.1 transcriptional regulator, XRE family [Campylobacter sp. MIT 12-5580]TQR39990.1 transcriptional regulator, XRE family [Campylobacter sp. MIT 12-8780]